MSPVRVPAWLTGAALSVTTVGTKGDVPSYTTLFAGLSVSHRIVAAAFVRPVTRTFEIAGGSHSTRALAVDWCGGLWSSYVTVIVSPQLTWRRPSPGVGTP